MTRPSDRKKNNKKKNTVKRTCQIEDFTKLMDHRIKLKEREKRDKYQDFARELKTREHENDSNNKCNWCAW